ncbi:MAG: bifunctional 2-polyprenyl-6-hydroxyphenol methylase/3-demethylubiquinol 3-O-methyltransferase UbiG [Rhodospirillales bacterium]|nr:bifunctional 2-polyprenyl-6-hydroxyphenol methylase/3-demethylubiquinol 3-O-methyltransferase UbiG [Rhodospirillales bacterium]MDH3912645.1 bifunctional 2-polyprenyl-6-hydroxyphenol methylase/3-demethylubiquinol 3-O-methyltransferase UbiG [Rhodospirillales bacterium]MDH3965625.1 bifunctional 2-polyprenyl-6-hydroxyphenol methylase/3-demethylubiquinol 3-O-methyltransferase UbiG [Rhodospirillales bacterium]
MTEAKAGPGPDAGGSVDPAEIAKFSAMAEEWWDPAGKFRPLHKLNPTRLAFVRDRIAGHFERDPLADRPLAGLSLLDIGCGGGLLAEPLCRLGAEVTGIDAAERNIKVAALHAAESGLAIDYRHAAAEDLAGAGARFDAVLNMEVVEHVADLGAFLAASGTLVKPGGAMVVATLNRTPKAFLLGIVGAEYLLRWLPPGTHDWRRFVRPSELARELAAGGLTVTEIAGMAYNPLTDGWRLARDTAVNYMVFAVKG